MQNYLIKRQAPQGIPLSWYKMLLRSEISATHTSRTSNFAVFTLAQVFFSRDTGLIFMPALHLKWGEGKKVERET